MAFFQFCRVRSILSFVVSVLPERGCDYQNAHCRLVLTSVSCWVTNVDFFIARRERRGTRNTRAEATHSVAMLHAAKLHRHTPPKLLRRQARPLTTGVPVKFGRMTMPPRVPACDEKIGHDHDLLTAERRACTTRFAHFERLDPASVLPCVLGTATRRVAVGGATPTLVR